MSDTSKSKTNKTEEEIMSHEFFTINEVATLLRVDRRTVTNLINNGVLLASRLLSRVIIIKKEDFMEMLADNRYVKHKRSKMRKNRKNNAQRQASATMTCKNECEMEKDKKAEQKTEEEITTMMKEIDDSTMQEHKIIDTSESYASEMETFVSEIPDGTPLYTLADICRKFKYTYGRFYNLRIQYNIPSVRVNRAIHFPVDIVDAAMAQEKERLGKDLLEHWYTCADIMRIYGLGKTQVRRFAETHNVRIKRCGHFNHYLKADWEAARKEAEETSVCTKQKRDY